MWPFRKKSADANQVPAEIQEYYQAEKRERAGVAWLLALATFVVVVVGVLGIFFGGKWILHRFNKNDSTTATTTPAQTKSSGSAGNKTPATSGAQTPTPPATTTQPSPSPQASTSTPTTAGTNNLPNTGPTPGNDD